MAETYRSLTVTAKRPHVTLHVMLPQERDLPDEPPPFLGAWPRVYAAVVLYLALVIAACYGFTRIFA
jgi:hypothetical protein